MTSPRRTFLVASAALPLGLVGCWTPTDDDRRLVFASLDVADSELVRLSTATALTSNAIWNWAQTLAHCAQSIEYSMTGFPRTKPEWFQRSAGAAAFGFFDWRGRMSHDLAEPIPGADPIDAATDPAPALERLRLSIRRFRETTAPLRPHFAYGLLDKPAYERAHSMHLANHLSAFRARAVA